MEAILQTWIDRWRLTPDGAVFVTEYTQSRIQPVRTPDGRAAVLKIATSDEEQRGAAAMAWWDGRGAAQVLACDGAALLLERLHGEGELTAMAARGGADDDEATRILCGVARRLHRPMDATAGFLDLERRFAELHRAAAAASPEQPLFVSARETVLSLLGEQGPKVALHGDMHHANALRSSDGTWLAIDPKGLVGDPGYDFANLLNNPTAEIAHAPGRLARQARVIAASAGQPLRWVLRWTLAHAALSAAWSRGEGREDWVGQALTTARIAQAELASLA